MGSRRDDIEACFARIIGFWKPEEVIFNAFLWPVHTPGAVGQERVTFTRTLGQVAGRKAHIYRCESAVVSYRFVKA